MKLFLKLIFALTPILFNINSEPNDSVQKLVIIGEGPAGLSAAICASRFQLEPLVIAETAGGQLAKATLIENWPGREPVLGQQLANDLRRQAKNLKTKFLYDTVTKVDLSKKPFSVTLDDNKEILTHCIIIATGAKPTKLGCPGEEQYLGKGIAICATCDAPLFKNKPVIVIGGRHQALREVDILTKYTNKITIINKKEDIEGPKSLVKKIKENKNIKILNNCTAIEFLGNDDWITGVKILDPQNNEKVIETQGIFVAIGSEPITELFKNQLILNDKGQILVQNDTRTSQPGVFAAGDVASNSRHQAPVAASFGYMAGMDAEEYLRKNKLI